MDDKKEKKKNLKSDKQTVRSREMGVHITGLCDVVKTSVSDYNRCE